MATLSVWTFPDTDGARQAENTLATLAARELITVDDAAMIVWPNDRTRPRTRQLHNVACTATLGDAFWGLLFGVAFYLPLLAPVGQAPELSSGSLRDVGIGTSVIEQVRADVVPGTSALFVLTSNGVADRVAGDLAQHDPLLVRADLTDVQESALREVFAV